MRFLRTLSAALLLSGCANAAPPEIASAPTPTPAISSTPAGGVTGTITRGGSGPCFGLRGDDGVDYALYVAGATRLDEGDRIRVQAVPMKLRIHCGAGKSVQAARVEHVS
jgi:hypothetical protein